MAEELNHPSRYVKLKKDPAPLQDITPGELNQSIHVPKFRCNECRHSLCPKAIKLLQMNLGVLGFSNVLRIRKVNSPCNPYMVHCCLHWCALCQEHREIKGRLSDDTVMPMPVVNPPPVQVMNAFGDTRDSASPSSNGAEQVHVEMQAL